MSEDTRALLHLFFILLMLLVLVGGSVAILLVWWIRGRDPHTGPVAAYLSEPPDDLSPGVVGTLVDEHADYHDILATLLGLGRYGAVRISQVAAGGRGRQSDFEITMVDPSLIRGDLDRTVAETVFGGPAAPGTTIRLSTVRDRFAAAERSIRASLYRELVDHGFFLKSPEGNTAPVDVGGTSGTGDLHHWRGLLGFSLDPFAFLAMGAGIVESLILMRVSRVMPRKTLAGREAAAKWNAFRVYLKDIRKYEKVEEAQELFERYLPYAVAFGLERSWVQTFAAAGASSPSWLDTASSGSGDLGDMIFTAMQVGHLTGHRSGSSGGDVSLPDIDLPNVGMPNLGNMPDFDPQAMADAVGSGLQGTSDVLGGLFDLAGKIFDSIDIDFD